MVEEARLELSLIHILVKFTVKFVYIRFIGTHKEYDKIDCANI